MKFALLAALVITLPAVCALVYGLMFGPKFLVYAALFSFALNTLPFVVAGYFMGKNKDGTDLGH